MSCLHFRPSIHVILYTFSQISKSYRTFAKGVSILVHLKMTVWMQSLCIHFTYDLECVSNEILSLYSVLCT